eukprot:scaffold1362_cov163-Amphora_coffeaeformis.AAC.8
MDTYRLWRTKTKVETLENVPLMLWLITEIRSKGKQQKNHRACGRIKMMRDEKKMSFQQPLLTVAKEQI